MDIAIIGAGAMGSLYGYYLAKGGYRVTLIDPWEEHVRAINDKGLSLVVDHEPEKRVFLQALLSPGTMHQQDLVIFFVKSYHTAQAVVEARSLVGPKTVVLTLQNGLGNAEIIKNALGDNNLLAGTTAHGATVLGPGKIRHAGVGETVIGVPGGGGTQGADGMAAVFNGCGLETRVSADIDSIIWGKLLINAAINPLTALLNILNGELFRQEHTREMVAMLVSEATEVAAGKGISLPYADPLGKVKSVSEHTAQNRSSMLQDRDRGRRTEIDFINGAIALEGQKAGIPVPCNTLITLLIKALER